MTDRTQRVKTGKCISDSQTVTCGVPQGKVLGAPTIPPTYKQHLSLSPFVKFHLFADDTCIFHSHHNISTLETELNIAVHNVINWLKANKPTLKCIKIKFVII